MSALPATGYTSFTDQLEAYDTTRALVSSHEIRLTQQYTRAPYLSLHEIGNNDSTAVYRLNLYADTLDHGPANSPPFVLPRTTVLRFFARALFRTATKANPVRIKALGVASISLYTAFPGVDGAQIPFVIETVRGTWTVDTDFAPGTLGCAITIGNSGVVAVHPGLQPPAEEFDFPTIEQLIRDDGQLADRARRGIGHPDNLSRLLRFQMLLATTCQEYDIPLALDIARFVGQVTAGIPKATQIHLQASSFLYSLAFTASSSTKSTSSALFVPSLDLTVTETVLKSRLAAASSFETAYQTFSAQEASSANIRIMGRVALEASEDAHKTYEVIGHQAKKRFRDAQRSLMAAQNSFQEIQVELLGSQEAFMKGIDAWKRKEMIKALREVVQSVAGVAVSVVHPPAGATSLVTAVSAIVAGFQAVEKAANLLQLINNLIALYQTMKPVLEKLGKVFTALQDANGILQDTHKDLDSLSGAMTGTLPTAEQAHDIFNMRAKWDEFELDMDKVLNEIKSDAIGGCNEYQLSIHKLVIRAKTVLECQSALAQASDENIRTLTQLISSRNHNERLHKATSHLHGQPELFRIYKEHMLDRLLHARTWVYLDFKAYLAAYMYFSLDETPPIRLSPIKPLPHFFNDSAALQAAVAQAEMRNRSQLRLFRFTSDAYGDIFGSDWKETLSIHRFVTFTIPSTHPAFRRYGRVRVTCVRCYLEGATACRNSNSITVGIACGESLVDKDLSGRQISFVTPSTLLEFDYVSESEEILMDGQYARPGAFLKPTPFAQWTIRSMDQEVGVGAITQLRLDMTCEVSVLRGHQSI